MIKFLAHRNLYILQSVYFEYIKERPSVTSCRPLYCIRFQSCIFDLGAARHVLLHALKDLNRVILFHCIKAFVFSQMFTEFANNRFVIKDSVGSLDLICEMPLTHDTCSLYDLTANTPIILSRANEG